MNFPSIYKKLQRATCYFIESIIRNIAGGLGQSIRRQYYKRRFKSCGENLKIGIGVVLQGCDFISLGSNVWIDDYCTIIAGATGDMNDREVKILRNKSFSGTEGFVNIGSHIHFAPFCFIHGFGGVEIKDYVGFSSGVKLYSMSNHYQSFRDRSLITYGTPMVKNLPVVFFKSPIVIEENVFVSLNSIILIGTIGKNSFIAPMSLVSSNIQENSIASGNPAKKIRNRFDNYKM